MAEQDLESELKNDLQRVPVPRGFADGVMARARLESASPTRSARPASLQVRWRWLWPALTLATAMLVLAIGGGYHVQQTREQQRQAALAEARFATAMRITGRTLARVDDEVARAGVKASKNIQAGERVKETK